MTIAGTPQDQFAPGAPSRHPITLHVNDHAYPLDVQAWLLNANQLGTDRQTNWTLPPNILGSGAK
ncbi:MAG: hypothetical protein DI537_47755 [Stutzerimonas stutzeri]|nr:MAG: hypothetical protein DI537_47755 [Stutzerimonas stutzeri]